MLKQIMGFPELFSTLVSQESMTNPYFKDEYATIELDSTIPCIVLTLNGIPRYSEHYQLVQKKRLELMHMQLKKFPKLHMLTDSHAAGPVLDEDVAYFKNQVMPEMEKAGVRYLAIVVPSSKFTQLTIKEMTDGAALIEVRCFEEIEEARQWLKEMTNR